MGRHSLVVRPVATRAAGRIVGGGLGLAMGVAVLTGGSAAAATPDPDRTSSDASGSTSDPEADSSRQTTRGTSGLLAGRNVSSDLSGSRSVEIDASSTNLNFDFGAGASPGRSGGSSAGSGPGNGGAPAEETADSRQGQTTRGTGGLLVGRNISSDLGGPRSVEIDRSSTNGNLSFVEDRPAFDPRGFVFESSCVGSSSSSASITSTNGTSSGSGRSGCS